MPQPAHPAKSQVTAPAASSEDGAVHGAALGVSTVALLDYPDGRLAGVPTAELAAHVTGLAARYHPGGLLVFDDTGITGHPDHRAATQAAVRAPAR